MTDYTLTGNDDGTVTWTDNRTWQPISTAPRDGTRILIAPRPGLAKYIGPVMMGKWMERNGRWSFGEVAGRNVDPTHWQPLPPPPED